MRLHDYIAAWRRRRYRPGSADCAQFAAGWVKASTGRDLAAGWRYRSLRRGQEVLRAAGYDDHVAYAAAHLEEVPILHAREGDIVVVEGQFGICAGGLVFVLHPGGGLGTVPLLSAERAFRV